MFPFNTVCAPFPGHGQTIFRRISLYFGGVLLKPQYAEIWVQRPIETRGCGSEYPL